MDVDILSTSRELKNGKGQGVEEVKEEIHASAGPISTSTQALLESQAKSVQDNEKFADWLQQGTSTKRFVALPFEKRNSEARRRSEIFANSLMTTLT